MRRDIWVTRYKPQEILFSAIDRYANGEPIDDSGHRALAWSRPRCTSRATRTGR